jgi:HK97 family phage portal protein
MQNYFQTMMGSLATGVKTLFSGRGGGGSIYPQRARQIPSARFDWLSEAGDFRQNPVVALGLDWIIRNVTSVPMRLYMTTKFGEEVELEGHPILDLLKKPNPIYSGHALVSSWITDLMCAGTAFSYIAQTNSGGVGELYWLDARQTAPDFPTDGSKWMTQWKYIPAGTGRVETFTPDQVIVFKRGIDSWNDRLGYTPLMACCREIALVNMLAGYTGAILKNTGVTNIVVTPVGDTQIQDKQRDQLKQSIMESIGIDQQGSPLVFSAPVSVSNLGTTPKDMLLQDVDMHAVARITSAMGLSPMLLGLPDPGKTYSNYREAQRAAWINAVVPFHNLIAKTLEDVLLPLYDPTGRMCLKWDYANVEALAEDQKAQAERAVSLYKNGLITRNEGRRIVALEPTEDGDNYVSESAPAPMAGLNGGEIQSQNQAEATY